MSIYLRLLILIGGLGNIVFVYRKLSKSQLKIMDAFFWIVFSAVLLVLGLFPGIGISIADSLGVISAANFVFLVAIFFLIIRTFYQSIRISNLESKVNELVQELAIREYCKKNESN